MIPTYALTAAQCTFTGLRILAAGMFIAATIFAVLLAWDYLKPYLTSRWHR
jgi:hypothetical protein